MTKGALNVMTRSLAHMLGGRGITVNTVSPGITETDMNQWLVNLHGRSTRSPRWWRWGATATPTSADAVAFFASDDGRWVTGQVLEVNGGLWLGPREER